MMNLLCPKCGHRNARYVAEEKELFIKCQCGYLTCVYSELGTATITRTEEFNRRELPKRGTLLHKYLIAIVDHWPRDMSTVSLYESVGTGSSRAASNCMRVLCHRQLVVRVLGGQGIAGGSIWQVSEKAREHFGLVQKVKKQ